MKNGPVEKCVAPVSDRGNGRSLFYVCVMSSPCSSPEGGMAYPIFIRCIPLTPAPGTVWNCRDFFREDGWRCIKSRSSRHFLAFAVRFYSVRVSGFMPVLLSFSGWSWEAYPEGYPSIFLLNHFKFSFGQPIYEPGDAIIAKLHVDEISKILIKVLYKLFNFQILVHGTRFKVH